MIIFYHKNIYLQPPSSEGGLGGADYVKLLWIMNKGGNNKNKVSGLLHIKKRLPYNPSLKEKARELRNNMTPYEKKLWYEFLSGHPARFRRQKIIGDYIVDFYSASKKLVIEIDGDSHFLSDGKKKYDKERTKFLNKYGICVLRFTNSDIETGLDGVCGRIEDWLANTE